MHPIPFKEFFPHWLPPGSNIEGKYLLLMILPFGEKKPEDFYYIYGTEQELRKDPEILNILKYRQLLSPPPYVAIVHSVRVKNKNHARIPLWYWAEEQIRKQVSKKRTDLTYFRHAGNLTKRIKQPYVIQFQQGGFTKQQLKDIERGKPIKPKLKMIDCAKEKGTTPTEYFCEKWLPDFINAMLNRRCAAVTLTEDTPDAKI